MTLPRGRRRPAGTTARAAIHTTACAVLALPLAAIGVVLVASPAQAATAAFVKQNAWDSGYVGAVTVTNDAAAPVAWRVEFDLPAGTTLADSWSGQVTHAENHYVVVGKLWNATLAAGASTTFGWVAHGTGTPLNCRLNGASCAGGSEVIDIRPPTRPGNLRVLPAGNQQIVRWDPATDDIGVAAYEVYTGLAPGSNLVATVTGTEYSMGIPPPAVFTYRVRALDAAGNASTYTEITPGGSMDVVAPSAPADLLIGVGGTLATVSWTAASDNRGVVGYDVFVNGLHVGATSRTSLKIPPVGFGEFRFEVQAFDAAGLRSPRLTRSIAIDPGPTSDYRHPPRRPT